MNFELPCVMIKKHMEAFYSIKLYTESGNNMGQFVLTQLLTVIGIFPLIGAWLIVRNMKAAADRRPARSTGVVIQNTKQRSGFRSRDGKRAMRWHALVKFKIRGGKTVKAVCTYGSSQPLYHGGQMVQVYYNPMAPQDYHIGNWKKTVLPMAGVLVFISLLFIICGIVLGAQALNGTL